MIKRYKIVDRSKWAVGPWDDEPEDEVVFEAHGFTCRLLRHWYMGTWGGYVHLPSGHPDHSRQYRKVNTDVDVHGGLTYSDIDEATGAWILGFDTAHAYDVIPAMSHTLSHENAYRTRGYAEGQTRSLARQLAERASSGALC